MSLARIVTVRLLCEPLNRVQHLCCVLLKKKTFITGLSMGGHGAINLFLDDVSRFRAAGSMSGVLDLDYEKGRLGLERLLGPWEPANARYAEESAINRIARAKDAGKPMVITCGYSDTLFGASRDFCERCKEEGLSLS